MSKKAYNIILSGCEGSLTVKKSRFIAKVLPCFTEEEARRLIDLTRKEHYQARHNCFSYRIGEPERVLERFSDDGEPQGTAGQPILSALRSLELYDTLAVVTRYFGGTLLGSGGLKRAYQGAVREALIKADIRSLTEGSLISLSTDYKYLDLLMREAGLMGLSLADEQYGEDVKLSFVVPDDMSGRFIETVSRVTLGGSGVKTLGRIHYHTGERGPVIYRRSDGD